MNPSANITSDAVSASGFAAILEELANKCLAGEPIDWAAYKRDYPEHVEELRQLLPAMRAVADLSRSARDGDGASTPDDRVAGTLGDFRILSELGRGGMGVVYEAEQISLSRLVALKVLPFAATLDDKQILRFKNEAKAAGNLHHPNIVGIYFVGRERGVYFYAMQLIEGQSLAQVISDLRLQILDLPERAIGAEKQPAQSSPASANLKSTICNLKSSTIASTTGRPFFHAIARLGMEAALALDYAHEVGVVHRDIKPGNLLVDGSGHLWVTDFGLAQMRGDNNLTMTGDLLGTLRYMSPEQALAKRVLVDHRTDIYSMGATLYELLTLEPVFPGADRQELLRQIAFEEPKALRRHNKSIPAELETIVMKALEKNPADRYATAKELAEDLGRFAKDEPIRARRPSLWRRVKQWSRHHKPLVTALLVVLFLGAVALGWEERRRSATQQAVTEDLKEAESWRGKEDWAKALQALERAQGRLGTSGLDSLQTRVAERRSELVLVAQLEKTRLESVFMQWGWGYEAELDWPAVDRAYGSVFAQNGLDVAELTAEEAIRRIQTSPISIHLVRALDNWAFFKDRVKDGAGDPLRAIAQAADDNKWRRKLRESRLLKNPAALENLAKSEGVLAQPPESLINLFLLLDREAGLQLLLRAQQVRPTDFWINYYLGTCLRFESGKAAAAVGFCRAALVLQPRSHVVYLVLSDALERAGDLPEAEAALRKALALKPGFVHAFFTRAERLSKQQKWLEAEAAYRKVIELAPTLPAGYINLDDLLERQNKLSEAEALARDVIETARKQVWPKAFEFAWVLSGMAHYRIQRNQYVTAEPLLRECLAIHEKQQFDSWQRYYALSMLGQALLYQQKYAAAEPPLLKGYEGMRQREAKIPRNDKRSNLRAALESIVRLYEPTEQKENTRTWRAKLPERKLTSEEALLDAKLQKFLKAQLQSADPAELVALAEFCHDRHKQLYAASAHLYREAFATGGVTVHSVTGFHFAEAAALAGCGQGKDGAALEAAERARLREKALAWLQGELPGYRRVIVTDPEKISGWLWGWQQDSAFAGVRGDEALAKLPESERSQWRKLWEDVEDLRKQATPRGFIQAWLVLSELVPYEGLDGAMALDLQPIPDEALIRPRAGDQVEVSGKTLVWKEHHRAEPYIDFAALYGPPSEYKLAYGVCYVHVDADRTDLALRVGSDDQAMLYLNGEEIYRQTKARALNLDEDEVRPIRLRKGTNVLVFKVVNQDGPGPEGSVHLVTKDGAAPEGIAYRLEP